MGYRVYMGPCTVNNSGNLVWAKKVLLADVSKANAVNDPTETSTCYIIDPVLTLSKNSIGTFDFTLPHSTIVSSEYQEMIKSCGGSTTYTAKVELSNYTIEGRSAGSGQPYIYYCDMTIKVPSANTANTKVSMVNLLHNYKNIIMQTDENDEMQEYTVYGDEVLQLDLSYTISGSGQIKLTVAMSAKIKRPPQGTYGFDFPYKLSAGKVVQTSPIATIEISNTIDGKDISSTISLEAAGTIYDLSLMDVGWKVNQTSSVTAEVTRSDITYASNVALKKLRVMIYDVDNDTEDVKSIVWVGYVSSTIIQFDRSIDVTCDEIIGVLQDGVTQLLKSSGTMNLTDGGSSVLSLCLINGSSHLDAAGEYYEPPTINRGTVTMLSGKTLNLEEKGSVYGVAWDVLNSYLIDEYDGYLRPRYELQTDGSIKTYLDYLSDATDTTSQTIEYGVNLTDMTYEEKYPSDFANNIVADATVTTTKGFWIFKSSSTNYISAHARDEDSIAKYGVVTKRIMPSDASTQTALQTACDEELEKYTQDIEPTITVKAIDCMDIDGESATDRLGFLKKTHIVSSPHGIDVTLVCTKATIYLNKPDKCTYTFGYAPKKLTDQQNSVTSTSSTTSNTTGAVVSYLNSKT